MEKKYTLEDFYFDLPDELIAQYPSDKRDESRLFILNKTNPEYKHSRFFNLHEELHEGDILVFNNARVIPARIFFRRQSGALIETILTKRISDSDWMIICNRSKRLHHDETLYAEKDPAVSFRIIERNDEGFRVSFNQGLNEDTLKRIGEIPLPPYIKRDYSELDNDRYQTIYARESGAVAAPTAGLHFTPELLDILERKGIEKYFLTLFVSWGTFQPVRDNDLSRHKMHREKYILPKETADALSKARSANRRIIAVGTTSLRVLESCYSENHYHGGVGETDIFIYPGRQVKSIDGIITNFHTPYSTLLMLVSAFAGYDKIMAAYREAVLLRYRFFSYGDSMLII